MRPGASASALITDVADLVLARSCLLCHRTGRVLCADCLLALRAGASDVPGRIAVPTTASLDYRASGRALVLAYKEQGVRALAPMLGILLGDAVTVHAVRAGTSRVRVVPVPPHRRSPRGFDALGGIVRPALVDLHHRGFDAHLARLVSAAHYRPLKGLGGRQRETAIAGALHVHAPGALGGGIGRIRDWAGITVIVDDVITSGATSSAMVSVMTAAGIHVDGIAAVAAVSPDRSERSRAPAPSRPRR